MKAARLEERQALVRAYCEQAQIVDESTVQELLRHVEEIGEEEDKIVKFERHKMQRLNKPFCRGGVGVEVLEVFWEELWLHFFWPTFWLHCILYFTYRGGFAPRIGTVQNAM